MSLPGDDMTESIGFHIAEHVMKLHREVLLAVTTIPHLGDQGWAFRLRLFRIVVIGNWGDLVSDILHGESRWDCFFCLSSPALVEKNLTRDRVWYLDVLGFSSVDFVQEAKRGRGWMSSSSNAQSSHDDREEKVEKSSKQLL
mmetsp:Transcript_20072/g.38063  ORF Transcript_20072/g.38063 Transcript_20072/m.38063 type:complete len:142 (+) Transcript_20072:1070-1495(+)